MRPADLIEAAKKLDPDKEILCQVVDTNGRAWMMRFELFPPNKNCVSFNVLSVSHPNLKHLPNESFISDEIDTQVSEIIHITV